MRAGSVTALAALAAATPAWAHTGVGGASGFAEGVLHPLSGPDHVLAMVAVGLWAGLVGGRALWAWPKAFVGVMMAGAVMGWSGLPMPGVEAGIVLSVVALGAAIALRLSIPVAAGALVCGLFALFHGHAHGAELPDGAGASAFVAGFSLATIALHAFGVGLGLALALARAAASWLPRLAGAGLVVAGLALVVG
jgi:urease accessory protein